VLASVYPLVSSRSVARLFTYEVPPGVGKGAVVSIRFGRSAARGVVCQGAVGDRVLGRFRVFRYEVRCWRDGVIPDLGEAVDSPRRLTDEPAIARRLLDLAPRIPSPVWGRDELGTGDMWNSNSVVSWLVTASGLDVESIGPPAGGRAPGWSAGIVTARRAPP